MVTNAEWQRQADRGDTVSAIKTYRAAADIGLAEAKAAVERWLEINRPPSVAYQQASRTAERVCTFLDRHFASAGQDYQYCVQTLSTDQSRYCGDSPLLALRGHIGADHDGRCDVVVFVELGEVAAGRERAAARAALAGGAKLVWVLQQDVTAVRVESAGGGPVYHLYDDAILDGGDVLLGFSCRVADLFA